MDYDGIDPLLGVVRMGDDPRHRRTLQRRVANGALVSPLPGIAITRAKAEDAETRIRTAWVWRPDAVFRGRAALALQGWSIDVDEVWLGIPDLRGTHFPGYRIFTGVLPRELVRWQGETAALVPAAAALDCATAGDLVPVLDGLRTNQFTTSQLMETAELSSARVRPLWRRAAAQVRHNPWSHPEQELHQLLQQAGVRGWTGNHPVTVGARQLFVDVALPACKLGIEVQSYEFHTTRAAFERDWERHNLLASAGWHMHYVSPTRIRDEPEAVVREIVDLVPQRHLTPTARLERARRRGEHRGRSRRGRTTGLARPGSPGHRPDLDPAA